MFSNEPMNESPAVKSALRFGETAIEMGFLTAEQLQHVLAVQRSNDSVSRLRPRKLIGDIIFEKGWMTINQIYIVLEKIFKEQQESDIK